MQPTNLSRAGRLALFLSLIFLISWEIYLRHKPVTISYDDNEALFADKMAEIYGPKDHTTVFIGSSRIKYDLDIPTWEALTGQKAVQLANVGSSPRMVLEALANDPEFLKRLVKIMGEPKTMRTCLFGGLTIFANLTTYLPVLSEEQRKISELKAYANSTKPAAPDELDDDAHATAREAAAAHEQDRVHALQGRDRRAQAGAARRRDRTAPRRGPEL